MMDIYFEKDYGKLYEEIEGGTCEGLNITVPMVPFAICLLSVKFPFD